MGFVTAMKTCFRKYFVFSGRARRSEMWSFFLFIILARLILGFIDALIFDAPMPLYALGGQVGFNFGVGPLGGIFSLLIFFPWLTVGVRRMHDIGRTGWWWGGLYVFAPLWSGMYLVVLTSGISVFDTIMDANRVALVFVLIWLVVNFIFTLIDTQVGHNKYGPDQKYSGVESAFD